MGGHGFARDNDFELIKKSADELVFELRDNEDSLNHYPFHFVFRVSYKLVDNKIRVRYEVKNEDEKFMSFGVGAHPAFNVPLKNGTFEDYQLTISPDEKRTFIPLDPPSGTLKLDERVESQVSQLPLTRALFDKDALVYTSSKEMKVSLTNKLDDHGVSLTWKICLILVYSHLIQMKHPLFVSNLGVELQMMKILMEILPTNLESINWHQKENFLVNIPLKLNNQKRLSYFYGSFCLKKC